MLDCIIIGAGPAGLAAATRLRDAGLSILVIEARDRAGGRAYTAEVGSQRIDLGAHWFELPQMRGPRRILSELTRGRRRPTGGIRLHEESRWSGRRSFWSQWNSIEHALAEPRGRRHDEAIADVLGTYWQSRDPAWRDTLDFHLALECGAPLAEVSARDYQEHEDTDYYFIDDGFGALIAAQAEGLPIQFGAPATRIRDAGSSVIVETAQGMFEARTTVLAVPLTCIAAGAIDFVPALPPLLADAIASLRPARYERALVYWPDSPLHRQGPDCLHIFAGERTDNAEILSCIDGGDLHYVEIGGNLAERWQGVPDAVAWRRDFAATFLKDRYGPEAAGAEIVHVTDWSRDPFALGSWAVCPPGAQGVRQLISDHPNPHLHFATEATSIHYWGTVTGAWLEGTRVAEAIIGSVRADRPDRVEA